MENVFQDPILIIAVVLFLGTVVILVWSIKKLQEHNISLEEIDDEETPQQTPPETTGLLEARLQEISTQLTDITQRLIELEKNTSTEAARKLSAVPSMDKAEMEKIAARLESRLDALAAEKSAPADSVSRLEGKLEGIHKLLILLTDSGNPDQK